MRFDVAGFLKDSKMWETQKRELQKELDAIMITSYTLLLKDVLDTLSS